MLENIAPCAVLTGATGFVGSRLSWMLLERGWTVRALHPPGCDMSQVRPHPALHLHPVTDDVGQITGILAASAPRVVVHLASLILTDHRPEDVTRLIESNIRFGACVLEAMRASGVRRFVNTGTSWQHFGDAAYSPVNLYAATKQAFEAIVAYYREACGLESVTLKLFDTYGPRDPRPKLMNLLCRAAVRDEPLDLTPGEQRLDLVHVRDVCRAFVAAMGLLERGAVLGDSSFAVCTGRTVSVRELVDLFNAQSGRALRVRWGGRAYRPREVMAPWSAGRPLPGWRAEADLAAGIAELLAAQRAEESRGAVTGRPAGTDGAV